MGLDMYLEKNVWDLNVREDVLEKQFADLFPVSATSEHKVKRIVIEQAYWRKSNAVHRWFVENVQDGEDNCEEHEVTEESLIELRELCRGLVDLYDDLGDDKKDFEKRAREVLPPTNGFFFGSIEVDEWYVEDLRETVKMLEDVEESPNWFYTYRSSW